MELMTAETSQMRETALVIQIYQIYPVISVSSVLIAIANYFFLSLRKRQTKVSDPLLRLSKWTLHTRELDLRQGERL